MNYKIGDKVIIKELTDEMGVSNDMYNYIGETAEITKIIGVGYKINLDNEEWNWSSDMLEPIKLNNKGYILKFLKSISSEHYRYYQISLNGRDLKQIKLVLESQWKIKSSHLPQYVDRKLIIFLESLLRGLNSNKK